jgi:hypothetical protein
MKTVLLTVLLAATTSYSMTNPQQKTWTFSYKAAKSQPFQIKKSAPTYEEAFKSAAKDCFKQMTQGKYPGEDRGLDIIDICANPKS